ncbi:MAG TPA: S-adenosylmethionine:tRNA ribosyltransferase-isomerase [Chitinophagaceae bacterium]|jgi:S-adenosylmethionine:tRNA ribosyltransferase-isomerase|nr:S-adenosylmethionine:tRNA ribosyltransferase-isomerase [Chitinophagaceae bacterium]
MTDPRTLSIKDFTYSLPEERIAKYPLEERDASKLFIYKEGNISEDIYRNIADHIPKGSLFVFNDTKVVEARLMFQKSTGGVIEIFCLEPHEHYLDITTAMMQHEKVQWHCLIGGASKWKHGQILEKKIIHNSNELVLNARYIEKQVDSFIVELSWNDSTLSFAEVLHLFGAIPLPPYIKREAESSDAERYQTVYAHYEGSVAAPTAGLHFTNTVLQKLNEKNIDTDFATLHVGAGTFKPVKTEMMKDHEMHAEHFTISKTTIQNLIDHVDKNIIAVGTTSLRTLESLYWLGVKSSMANGEWSNEITQWEVYDHKEKPISTKEALENLINWMNEKDSEILTAKTQIIIAPGYQFKIVNGLITNFHQPQSTLLLLVAAFIGNDWKKVYDYAFENNFRFLSYGDGSLLWRNS